MDRKINVIKYGGLLASIGLYGFGTIKEREMISNANDYGTKVFTLDDMKNKKVTHDEFIIPYVFGNKDIIVDFFNKNSFLKKKYTIFHQESFNKDNDIMTPDQYPQIDNSILKNKINSIDISKSIAEYNGFKNLDIDINFTIVMAELKRRGITYPLQCDVHNMTDQQGWLGLKKISDAEDYYKIMFIGKTKNAILNMKYESELIDSKAYKIYSCGFFLISLFFFL